MSEGEGRCAGGDLYDLVDEAGVWEDQMVERLRDGGPPGGDSTGCG
ncbi:MAG: hypothetical protein ACOYBY_14415 [Dermatophilaceae bacterium]